MTRTRIYVITLIGFFLMWGVFGFVAAAPRGAPSLQETAPAVDPEGTASVEIPVTGEPQPVWTEVFAYYGLIGLAALFLILALLSFANKSTAPYARRKAPPFEKTHKN